MLVEGLIFANLKRTPKGKSGDRVPDAYSEKRADIYHMTMMTAAILELIKEVEDMKFRLESLANGFQIELNGEMKRCLAEMESTHEKLKSIPIPVQVQA